MRSFIRADRLNELIGESGGLTKFCTLNGVSRNIVCKVLRGDGDFHVRTLLTICGNGNASIDWLLGRTEEREVK